MRIACVGDNCIDYYDATGAACPGGNPVNVAVYARRMGVETAYLGAVGTDRFGDLLIRRLEEELYKNYLPKNYSCEDVITYQWNQNRQNNFRGQFNFYYSITRNYVSKVSMFIYILIVLGLGVMCEIAADILYFMVQFL